MKIDKPLTTQIPSLKLLWKEAFGDTDEFINMFFSTAFSTDRCRCVTLNGNIIAALYWFNCQYNNKPIAYLYAVATAKAYRGQGICHMLMKDTHQYLAKLGYEGVILVPGNEGLFKFYENIGYKTCSYIHKFQCTAIENITEDIITETTIEDIITKTTIEDAIEGTLENTIENLEHSEYISTTECTKIPESTKYINQVESINNTKNSNNVSKIQLLSISKDEYGKLRRQLLPENSVIQENENLNFLQDTIFHILPLHHN